MNKFQERSNERRVEDSSLYIAAGDRDERHALISTDGVSASLWNSEDHNATESKNSTRLILTPENRADVLLGIKQNGVSTYHRLFGQHSTKFDYPGSLVLSNTTDADSLAEKNCALKIGDVNGLHLEFDGNEIIAKASPTTPNSLYINGSNGGDVYLANSKFHAKADGGADVNGALSVTGTVTSTGVIKTTGGSIIANDCTSYNAGVSGGYISTGGRIAAVSGASDSYPQMMFVVNKSKTTWTQLRSTNSSGTYTVTLPAASGTLALSSSDIRLKENINPTQVKALDVLNKINLYEYDWKSEGREGGPHWGVGMVADQIEPLDKNLVSGGGFYADGTMNVKTIDTFYLCGYIVKSIQEISKEIENIKERL